MWISIDLNILTMDDDVLAMFYNPTNQDIALISFSAFGFLQMISVILFWYCHLRHHQSHPVYRIRHPKFWTMCTCTMSFQIAWKGVVTYLRLRSYISIQVYQFSNQLGVMLLGFGCVFARSFVLWYTVKFQQNEQNLLFKSVLLSSDGVTNNSNLQLNKKSFLYKHEKHMSNPFRVFGLFQAWYFILSLVGGVLSFTVGTKVSQLFITTVVSVLWLFLFFLIYGVWRTGHKLRYKTNTSEIEINTRFMDYFNFRMEITLIWLDVLVFVPLRSVCGIIWEVGTKSEKAHKGLVILAFMTLLSQMIPTLTQIAIPYWTYTNRQSSILTRNASDITLFDVLCDRHGFFLFVNHAIQELNLENISCLIAIYQFKKIKTSHDKTVSDVSKPMTMGIDREEFSSEMRDSVPDLVNVTSKVELPKLRCSLSSHTSAKDIRDYTSKVLELPWNDLPFTECTSNMKDSKYVQAKKIYEKHLTFGSIHTVNIAGVVRNRVLQAFEDIEGNECGESDVLEVFDVVLPNICSNLENMMDRFRRTKEFESLTDLTTVEWHSCPTTTPTPT
eukprot:559328_1